MILKLDESLCRSRRNIRTLSFVTGFVYFCTFTFSDCKTDRSDLDALSKALRQFLTISKTVCTGFLNTLSFRSVTKMAHGIFTALFRGFRPLSLFVPKLLHGVTRKRIR